MPGTLTVRRARLVLRDRVVTGDLLVEDGVISRIAPRIEIGGGTTVDADGRLLLPGAVDLDWRFDQVDELGLRTRAALRGGVTTVVAAGGAEDPRALAQEHDQAGETAVCHLGVWQRASAERGRVPLAERARGWLLGGELLHDDRAEHWFAAPERVVVVDPVDPRRLERRATVYAGLPDVLNHALICDVDSAVASTVRALDLARRHGAPVHLLHVGSAEEAELLAQAGPRVSAAVRLHSLLLDERDAADLRERGVVEPPLRKARHREALLDAVRDGRVKVVAPGDRHVPYRHKALPWPSTPVGGPAAEWLVPLLATCAASTPWPVLARAFAEEPARVAGLTRKGRLEVGWDGDLVLLDDRVTAEIATIHSPAGWSTYAGRATGGRVDLVALRGRVVLQGDEVVGGIRGGLV